MKKYPKTLVIIPAFNEAKNVGSVIDNIKTYASFADIAVINDGSEDSTAKIAEEKGAAVLNLPYNMGIGGAMQTGYIYAQKAGYQIAVQVDADGQHPVKNIPELIDTLSDSSADMVIGSRYLGKAGKEPLVTRAVGKWILSKIISLITGQKITDSSSGFRAVNQRTMQLLIKRYPRDYPEPESVAMLIKEGLKVIEIAVQMNERCSGNSSITIHKGIYYVIKVTVAILIDAFESTLSIKEN